MEKIRRHMIFYGDVQGVGFRWRASSIARKYGISGWVQNLWDGTVEMEAEGTPRDLACLVEELEHARFIEIGRIEARDIPPEGSYAFEIR